MSVGVPRYRLRWKRKRCILSDLEAENGLMSENFEAAALIPRGGSFGLRWARHNSAVCERLQTQRELCNTEKHISAKRWRDTLTFVWTTPTLHSAHNPPPHPPLIRWDKNLLWCPKIWRPPKIWARKFSKIFLTPQNPEPLFSLNWQLESSSLQVQSSWEEP